MKQMGTDIWKIDSLQRSGRALVVLSGISNKSSGGIGVWWLGLSVGSST